MVEDDPVAARDLDAGTFGQWLADVSAAIRGERGSDVPCGGCTACCTSSQFIHIGPDEADVLAHIPPALLFPAPGRPRGHVLLGFDERGHCPMLIEGRCSIYAHRPMTCRTYDCRVFAATGVVLDDDGQAGIAAQASRWEFRFADRHDDTRHEAVEAAAAYLRENPGVLPDGEAPRTATQLAVRAIEVHGAFLGLDAEGGAVVVEPDPDEVRNEARARRGRRRESG